MKQIMHNVELPRFASAGMGLLAAVSLLFGWAAPAHAQAKKPNILFIMGDDVGWFNIGAYHQGIMSGETPNLDRLAREGMRFTDYYAEARCHRSRICPTFPTCMISRSRRPNTT